MPSVYCPRLCRRGSALVGVFAGVVYYEYTYTNISVNIVNNNDKLQ